MKYAKIQQLAKALKKQGVITKKFNLGQKAEILIAEIQKNITKVDRNNISKELAAILLDFTILAVNNEIKATKTPQKTTKKAAKSTKKTETEEKEMTQDEFNYKFTQGYVELLHEEETIGCGVVTTKTPDVQQKLFKLYGISATTFYAMYKKVPTLFEIPENGNVMCRIATKKQADGTYKPEH